MSGYRPHKRSKTGSLAGPVIEHNLTDSCKAVDYQFNGVVTNAGDPLFADERVQCVNGVAVGAAPYQRVGSSIELVQLQWDCYLYPTEGIANTFNDVFKLALVYDRQPNGTLPSFDDIFTAQYAGGGTSNDPMSPQNVDNIARFFVLRDMKWNLAPSLDQFEGLGLFPTTVNTFGTAKRGNMISDKCSLMNLPTIYSGSGHTLSNITTGALYFVTNGYFGTILEPETAWSFNIQLRT